MDQRLISSHGTLNAILNIKISKSIYWEWKEWNFSSSCKKFNGETQEGCLWGEHNCQADFKGRQNDWNQYFSEEDDSENESDKHVYENITQVKCGSGTDDQIESTDEIETVNRWNSEYDDNSSVHNNGDMSWWLNRGIILIQMKTRVSICLITIPS